MRTGEARRWSRRGRQMGPDRGQAPLPRVVRIAARLGRDLLLQMRLRDREAGVVSNELVPAGQGRWFHDRRRAVRHPLGRVVLHPNTGVFRFYTPAEIWRALPFSEASKSREICEDVSPWLLCSNTRMQGMMDTFGADRARPFQVRRPDCDASERAGHARYLKRMATGQTSRLRNRARLRAVAGQGRLVPGLSSGATERLVLKIDGRCSEGRPVARRVTDHTRRPSPKTPSTLPAVARRGRWHAAGGPGAGEGDENIVS